jgi:hypothetical protein
MDITSNARLLMVNDADDASLSLNIGNEISTLPLVNLQTYGNAKLFRCYEVAKVQFTYVWDELRALSGVCLNRHNMSVTGTWRIEIFSDAGMTDLLLDSTAILAVDQKQLGELEFLIDPLVAKAFATRFQSSEYYFDVQLAQAMRITLVDPDNEYGFIDVTRLYAGKALNPQVNFSYGHSLGLTSNAKPKRSAGGGVYVKNKAVTRKSSFNLKYLTDAERSEFFNAVYQVGDHTDWYISMFPTAGGQKQRHYAFACMFTSIPDFTGNFNNNFQGTFAVGEI